MHHKHHKHYPTPKGAQAVHNEERFTNATGSPVADNTNSLAARSTRPSASSEISLFVQLPHSDREATPERRMHTKGWAAYSRFTVTYWLCPRHIGIKPRSSPSDIFMSLATSCSST
ncbi:catalase [Brucella sp. C7-11G]